MNRFIVPKMIESLCFWNYTKKNSPESSKKCARWCFFGTMREKMFCQFQKVCELLFFGTMREKMFCQFQKTCKLLFFGTMRAILVRIVPKQTIWAGLCLQSEGTQIHLSSLFVFVFIFALICNPIIYFSSFS